MNDFLKGFILLFLFLLLDIIKPFGFYLYIEFLFLGIVFCALNIDFKQTFILAFIFGYIKNLFLFENIISILEFPIIVIIIYYFKNRINPFLKFILICVLILFHIALNNIYLGVSYFPLRFFIQSISIYYLFLNNKKCLSKNCI